MNVTSHHYHLQQPHLNLFILQQNMWVLFVNLSVVCLNHLLRLINFFVQISYLFVLYRSQCLTAHCINLLLPLHLVSVLLELQLQPFPLIYQTFAILMLRFDFFLQSLKLPLLLSLLFLLMKNMHLLPLLSLLIHQILHVLVLPLLQHFLFYHIRTVTELLQLLVPIYLPILRLVLLIL